MKELIYKGKAFDVYKKDVLLPNGMVVKYDVIEHNGAVGILAFIDDNVILVKQNRPAVDRILLEIPAGKIEDKEDPLTCCKRELEEETGFKANKYIYLGEFYPSVGYTNEVIYLFLATDLEKGNMHLDPLEFLDLVYMNKNEFHKKIMNNEIQDSKTIIAYLKYCSLR